MRLPLGLAVIALIVVTGCSVAPVATTESDGAQTAAERNAARIREWFAQRRAAPLPVPHRQTEAPTPAPVPPEVVEAIPPPPKIDEPKPPTADLTPSSDPVPKTIEKVKPGPGPKRPRPRVKQLEREHNKPAQHRSISAADCARLRNAVATYGSGMVEMGARMRGYSSAQIAFAKRACGVR